MRLGVHLAILALLEHMTVRLVLGRHGRMREADVIAQVLVVDGAGRRSPAPSGAADDDRSSALCASSGVVMPWKSLQVCHQLVARLLLL